MYSVMIKSSPIFVIHSHGRVMIRLRKKLKKPPGSSMFTDTMFALSMSMQTSTINPNLVQSQQLITSF